jgi:hypothetical protein
MARQGSKMAFETSKEVKVTESFDEMGLNEELIRGIYAYGKWRPAAVFSGIWWAAQLELPSNLLCSRFTISGQLV